MKDLNCFLAGLANLSGPLIMLIFWRRKTGARLYPALIALGICFPVFFIGSVMRSGFSRGDFAAFYIQQGLLFGILEECTKFVMLSYPLASYNSRKDAVTYGIGHGSYELLGSGIACLGLIGTGRAAPDILLVNIWGVTAGSASVIALTIIIFYGIQMGRNIVTLPCAVLLHAFGNALKGIFIFSTPIVIAIDLLITSGECYAAYRCWKALESPYEDIS